MYRVHCRVSNNSISEGWGMEGDWIYFDWEKQEEANQHMWWFILGNCVCVLETIPSKGIS